MKFDEQINIQREENGDYLITWCDSFARSPVEIYAAESPEEAANGESVGRAENGRLRVASLRLPRRHYFHLVPDSGAGVTYGERALSVPGATNLRDLGGYLTGRGRRVRWGRLYRSGRLSLSPGAHRDYLATLGMKVNCDLRHASDFVQAANTLPDDVEKLNYPVDAGSFSTFFENLREDQLDEASMVEVMQDVNRQLVKDYQAQYREMFAALLAAEDGGFLVNCTAGKDRTGFACALILSALDVPRQSIFYDYLLSLRYFKVDRDKLNAAAGRYSPKVLAIFKSGVTEPLADVRAEYLQVAFDTMEALSGSVDQFLEDAYGVGAKERALLRERYTVWQ